MLLPGARGWTEVKAAAKKILQSLGELQDIDRPLLTYTPQQLGALLQQQGVEVRWGCLALPDWQPPPAGVLACKPVWAAGWLAASMRSAAHPPLARADSCSFLHANNLPRACLCVRLCLACRPAGLWSVA